jgi:hypothetical protein
MNDRKLYLVFSNPVAGKEREFNEWYENVHLHDVLSTPGMLTAQRFELCDTEMMRQARDAGMPVPTHRYLIVYEMEGDIDATMAKIQEAVMSGVMVMSDSLDLGTVAMSFWSPHGPKLSAS